MRLLTRRQRGLTLIELMVGVTIIGLMITFASPFLGDHFSNTRMREGMNTVMAQALYAQSEALKRNARVRLTVTASATNVTDIANNIVLRQLALTPGLSATTGQLDFAPNGLPTPLGTELQIVVSQTGTTCSAEARCPSVRIGGGGGIRVCGNHLSCP